MDWFLYDNGLRHERVKANPEKYHILVTTNEKRHLNGRGIEISYSKCQKLLETKIDCKLMFDSHVKSVQKS